MENVKKCITPDESRKYGLWEIKDENTAFRRCKCCDIVFERGITKNILNQIKKQYEATVLLESFLSIYPSDVNLIGYLNVILEDAVDYIDDNNKLLLDQKLHELNSTTFVSEENKIMIENFRKAISNDDNDLFFDTMEYFKVHNVDSLQNFNTNSYSK